METDTAEQPDPVTRRVGTLTREGDHHRLLTVERTITAGPAQVWEALTTAERIGRWLMPVSGQLETGGRYQLEGNAGGEVLACVGPERLALSWEYDGWLSWVDVSLRPTGDGTLLQLDHTAPSDDDQWADFGPGAVGIGWEMSLLGLAEHLRSPDVERVAAPPDLGSLLAASGAEWAAAAIAAGEDPAQARAAARRCVSAYVGD